MTLTLEQINQELEHIEKLKAKFQVEPAPQEQPAQVQAMASEETQPVPEWATPAHKEIDPFDAEYDLIAQTVAEPAESETTQAEVTPFMRRASILIERGIPVAPLPPLRKFAPPKEWEKLATTDVAALAGMNPHPDGNTAAVARAESGVAAVI